MAKRPRNAIKKGDVVVWDEIPCRVMKRRRVTSLAMFQTSEFEVLLETLDGAEIGWVGENEVEKVSGEAGG